MSAKIFSARRGFSTQNRRNANLVSKNDFVSMLGSGNYSSGCNLILP